ncbi:polysaccharide biosynthesis tyrosine autokinase [Blastococcus sp. TF02A-35]|uniref:polysaccharide biosynthesis tyrosine autokinase n=1 Tax=Blastococcus sp. TF02A-35 TaxID=2559612 RepID=UPI0010743873|nr:polysaccharide biosynthesis tyrosine autokinase [Blastococcus sp. TF02A_35]TFV53713.1 polysaccharide biosynthesis tyrosine autokinase [Blastococcus sp. TF02A_35]
MELREVLAALRAGWWLPLVGLVVGGAAALGVSLLQTPLYTSSTQLFVSTRDTASTSEAFQGSQFSQQRVTSYARLITGEELAQRVIDRLGLEDSAEHLRDRISATAVTGTVLIDVTVTDESPERAQRIADAVGAEFTEFAAELETPDGAEISPIKVTVTDGAEAASAPGSPQTTRNVALGLLVGLLVGAGLAVLRARLDRTVKDPDEVVQLTGVPVIGTVLRDDALEKRHVVDRNSNTRTAEDYRQLRTNLQFLNVDEPPKVIMVTSALPSEGKTTAVVNLGLALADAGRTVTIVEADLRKPKVTRYLGIVAGVGLTNVLAGTAEVEEVVQQYGPAGLSIIASGPTPPNPGELLASSNMYALLEKLRDGNDFVLVDAPPLLPVADSTGLAVFMDGVLLSVRYGSTRKEQLQQAAASLAQVGAKTLGVILNIVPSRAELASAYGYGYGYEEGGDKPRGS